MIRWNRFKKNSPLEAKDTTSGNVQTADDSVDHPPAGEMESGTSLFCGKIHTIMFPNQLGAVFGFQVFFFIGLLAALSSLLISANLTLRLMEQGNMAFSMAAKAEK